MRTCQSGLKRHHQSFAQGLLILMDSIEPFMTKNSPRHERSVGGGGPQETRPLIKDLRPFLGQCPHLSSPNDDRAFRTNGSGWCGWCHTKRSRTRSVHCLFKSFWFAAETTHLG
ncbi:uncharacterized protein PV06_03297 [Exophiala oligosperma]|uniref:Uncharacterized protein n=1 Tax=Exophiala oligosperma TaxID=215243 RepID=A0A0D2DQX0_9EURO|nr:uncharacterized protein PV06_03297 [Exophiala oligosperma]KIW44855.1 hypothetical protein PV06_03297 [Exophiala oligosperma]